MILKNHLWGVVVALVLFIVLAFAGGVCIPMMPNFSWLKKYIPMMGSSSGFSGVVMPSSPNLQADANAMSDSSSDPMSSGQMMPPAVMSDSRDKTMGDSGSDGSKPLGPFPGQNPSNAEDTQPVDGLTGTEVMPSMYPAGMLDSQQLLPNDRNSIWAQAHPEITAPLAERDFLSSSYMMGINTQGSSLRNANRQVRSDPPIPKTIDGAISPWLNSTIDPDVNHRPMEIGGDY